MIALGAIGVVIGGAFAGLAVEAAGDWSGALAAFDPYMLRVARFTLWQALLSTCLSVLPAVLVAQALSRQPDLPGRQLILRLFATPLAIPALVAALGVLALLGRAGLFAGPLGVLSSGQWPGIYGLSGILVAHVFFNMPLATRLFLEALDSVPDDQYRLAAQLGMGGTPSFRFVAWPAMRRALPGIAGLVFMLCVTSFTIVLMLGGGPRATTLEVAIYQALRFDFDPARATALTIAQLVLTLLVATVLLRLGAATAIDANLSIVRRRPVFRGGAETALNFTVISLAFLFVAGPMAAIVVAGLEADLARLAGERVVQQATLTSLVLAGLSAVLCVALSFALVAGRRALELVRRTPRPGPVEWLAGEGAALVLVVPPIVIGAGWFIALRHFTSVFALAPVMVVVVNAIMAMPFAIRVLRPAYDAGSARHERLCASLGISGWNRLRLVDWPVLRRPLATALAFAAALSLGDLGVIALFGSDQVQTLPYLLHARLGSYRTADAAGLALMLGLVCFLLVSLASWLSKEPAP
jgi:thiamine transport system permease protein